MTGKTKKKLPNLLQDSLCIRGKIKQNVYLQRFKKFMKFIMEFMKIMEMIKMIKTDTGFSYKLKSKQKKFQ